MSDQISRESVLPSPSDVWVVPGGDRGKFAVKSREFIAKLINQLRTPFEHGVTLLVPFDGAHGIFHT